MKKLSQQSKLSPQASNAEGLSPRLLLALYLFATVIPLLLVFMQGLPFRSIANEFATFLGLVGFTWLLLSFLLSGRFRTISGRIGIDKTMRLHQLMAIVLGLLIFLHPFFYTLSFNKPLPWDATRQFSLMLTTPGFVTGMIAWILLPVLILTAVFRDQYSCRYERWRWLHGMGALVVVVTGLIHVLEVGRYSENIFMRIFWLGLLGFALLTLLRTYFLMPMFQKNKPFKVLSVEPASLTTWHVTITPDHDVTTHVVTDVVTDVVSDAVSNFKAGQFAWLKLKDTTFSLTEHPFSMSSAPSDLPNMRFTIKESGDFTNHIGQISEGQRAFIDGPHGHFIIDDQEQGKGDDIEGIVMIAGGIGVAPMMSIIREMAYRKDPRPVRLLYGNRIESQIAFRDEFESASETIQLDVHYVLSDPPEDWSGLSGFLDSLVIHRVLNMPNKEKWLYLLCGPPVMLDSAIESLKAEGIPNKNIIHEKFSYL